MAGRVARRVCPCDLVWRARCDQEIALKLLCQRVFDGDREVDALRGHVGSAETQLAVAGLFCAPNSLATSPLMFSATMRKRACVLGTDHLDIASLVWPE